MRKLLFALALTVSAAGFTSAAQAAQLGFTGTLAVQISTLPAIPVNGSGVATVNDDGPHLTSLQIPASPFQTQGVIVPVTDPAAFPILGVQVTAHNADGSFSGGAQPGGLGGTMSVQGTAKVCLFAPCAAPPPANVNVPLSVVGVGGTTTVSFLVNLTVRGAPWSEGTATIGTTSQAGFAHGPASATSSTAQASGVVRLVTPIFISTNIGASAVLPAFGILTLHFVPEPGTLVLLGSGIAGLVMFGRSRRS